MTTRNINRYSRKDLMTAAHRYAKRLVEQTGCTYREAIKSAMKEGWQAGRCWKQTPVGPKQSTRMKVFVEQPREGSHQSDDNQDPLDFSVLI